MNNQSQEEFIQRMEQSFQVMLGNSSFEDMRQCMAQQTAIFRELAIQQNQNSYLKDGPQKLSVMESKDTLENILRTNNHKYMEWCTRTDQCACEKKYLKGTSYILNAYYNPNPVIELLTNAKKGTLYKKSPTDTTNITYSYDLDHEGLPIRTLISSSYGDKRGKQGFYIRKDKEESFILFNEMNQKIESIYRAIYQDHKVVRYEEALCNYFDSEDGDIVSMEIYDISYKKDELMEFTLYRYDGSEYIISEQYESDPSKSSGLRRRSSEE